MIIARFGVCFMYAILRKGCIMDLRTNNSIRKLLLSYGEYLKNLFSNIYFHSGRTDSAGGRHDVFR
jgi:hypothetical protein